MFKLIYMNGYVNVDSQDSTGSSPLSDPVEKKKKD